MFYVYIIKSTLKNWSYVGLSQNLLKRLELHNSGGVRSTKPYRPFKLIFAQIVNNRIVARDLEKYLKIKFNKEALLNII